VTAPDSFVCPRCAHIAWHPLEIYFRWCPKCRAVTGTPRQCPHETQARVRAPWQIIRDNEDDCLIAIENGRPLRTDRLQALPPWRAVMLAYVAQKAGVALEQGTVEQLKAEASAVGGEGTLGRWWERNPA
jgi:hypothetical protein